MYLRQFDTVSQARVGLKEYFEFYNHERLHQSLDYHTPAQVYLNNSSDNTVLYQPNSILIFSAHDKKIKKSDKTRHNSNFFDELNHAKSYQT